MIKKLFLTAIITVAAVGLYAQDQQVQKLKNEAKREIKKDEKQKEGWTKGGVFGLNVAQGSSHNWAAGAENFLFHSTEF